jgi:hypothetical protein
MGLAMRILTNQGQEPNAAKGFDPIGVAALNAGIILSALVWVLAIAKVIDLCWH